MKCNLPPDPKLLEAQLDAVDRPDSWHKDITLDDIISLKIQNPNLTAAQGARILGCSRANIYDHLKKAGLTWSGVACRIESFKTQRADLLAFKQAICLENLTSEKAQKSSNRDLAVTFGILYEKERLDRGESTANVSVLSQRLDAAKRRLKEKGLLQEDKDEE